MSFNKLKFIELTLFYQLLHSKRGWVKSFDQPSFAVCSSGFTVEDRLPHEIEFDIARDIMGVDVGNVSRQSF